MKSRALLLTFAATIGASAFALGLYTGRAVFPKSTESLVVDGHKKPTVEVINEVKRRRALREARKFDHGVVVQPRYIDSVDPILKYELSLDNVSVAIAANDLADLAQKEIFVGKSVAKHKVTCSLSTDSKQLALSSLLEALHGSGVRTIEIGSGSIALLAD